MRIVSCLAALLALTGCRSGYQRSGEVWTWVTRNAAVGKAVDTLAADVETFAVLDDSFARDRRTVWVDGSPLPGADAGSFESLGGGYGRDRSHVYYGHILFLRADPQTFERLDFPYSRDREAVFCGTVPLDVDDPSAFRVVRRGEGTVAARVRDIPPASLSEALVARGFSPDSVVLVGTDGVGQAGDQRFEGALPVPAP